MKKLMCLILSVLMVLMLFAACDGSGGNSETDQTEASTQQTIDPNAPLSDGNTLKVLAIGNSFSNNTTEYLYDIAKAEGVTDIVIGRLYISGCSLAKHVENAKSNAAAYIYYKNNSGKWERIESASLLYALQDEDWDIITMQQASGASGVKETYIGTVDQRVSYVNENKTNPNARLVWHMTWAYQEGSTNSGFIAYYNDQLIMYTKITEAVQQVIEPMSAFHSVIPVGTAIQNVRTSYIGDNLTHDTYHLNDLGKVIGGYTWYAHLTGKPLQAINLTEVNSTFTLTDSEKAVIIEAVNAAIETPYAVTQSTN